MRQTQTEITILNNNNTSNFKAVTDKVKQNMACIFLIVALFVLAHSVFGQLNQPTSEYIRLSILK